MDIIKILASDNYIICNKLFAKKHGLEEAVLLGALCSYQNSFGGDWFYREQEKILEDTALTLYSLRKCLSYLKKLGIVSIEKKGMPAKYFYKINADRLIDELNGGVCNSRVCEIDRSRVCEIDRSAFNNNTTSNKKNYLLNNSIPNKYIYNNNNNICAFGVETPSARVSATSKKNQLFEEIWELYPRKIGKSVAFKAYQKSLKDGTSVEEIRKGVENYARYCKANNIDLQYIKQGATWFNQRCWQDEYDTRPLNTSRPAQQQYTEAELASYRRDDEDD